MRYEKHIFIVMGLAAVAAAFLQPADRAPQAQRAVIGTMMEKQGYVASGRSDIGSAVAILKFSSRDCSNIRVLPVSVLFQEMVLLKNSEGMQDSGIFIYRNESWKDPALHSVAASRLSQIFRQMARWQPDPAIDTMLYVVAPRQCGRLAGMDWSGFWRRNPDI